MTIRATQSEVAKLAGTLDYLKGRILMHRKDYGKDSYTHISKTFEEAVDECAETVDKILYFGVEGK